MKFNAKDREQLRLSLLRYLEENPMSRFGLPTSILAQRARNEGFNAQPIDIEKELDYLVEKNLAAQVDKGISPENRAWRITAEGRDFIAQRELE